MQEVAISEFKAKCLSLLQQVSKTREPIRVTRFGKPVADVVPLAEVQVDRNAWIGSGHGTAKILGDIISPASEAGGVGGAARLKLLLDTHIWLWAYLRPKRLRPHLLRELRKPTNELWLSPISTWEALTLHTKGRIQLPTSIWLHLSPSYNHI